MYKQIIHHSLILLLLLSSCRPDLVDPNAASEDEVLSTREGLISASIGLRAHYATNSLLWIIENNALTTHEVSVTSSFQTAWDLEDGMDALTPFNSNIGNQWTSLLKVRSMATAILGRVDEAPTTTSEKNLLKAQALFFKAAAMGAVAQFFTHVPVSNQVNAEFQTRTAALEQCVIMLRSADKLLDEISIDQELMVRLCGQHFDLQNSIRVYLSRYLLFLGNYQEVLEALSGVDQTAVSLFDYSVESPNPIYNRVFGSNRYYQPVDGFGLPFEPEEDDQRVAFYLDSSDAVSLKGLNIETLIGFYGSPQAAIPVYLSGEIYLNRAEAFLYLDMPDDAVDMINHIRGKTNDPLGVNADLGPYTGPADFESIREELYRQRCMELFMSGLKLEDSRRLGRPSPLADDSSPLERNRNFYPFPNAERANNNQTPEDPSA